MKMTPIVLLLGLGELAVSVRGQGTFQNLDFEAAHVEWVGTGFDAASALPGWAAFSGTTQLSTIQYWTPVVAFGNVTLMGSNSYVIAGNFSVLLGVTVGPPGSIVQTGLVPSDARSLFFEAAPVGSGNSLAVSLGGVSVPYLPLSSGPNYTLYGADVSAFAGQTAALSFMGTAGFTVLDDIRFSPEATPEPSATSLMLIGSGVLLYVRALRALRKTSPWPS